MKRLNTYQLNEMTCGTSTVAPLYPWPACGRPLDDSMDVDLIRLGESRYNRWLCPDCTIDLLRRPQPRTAQQKDELDLLIQSIRFGKVTTWRGAGELLDISPQGASQRFGKGTAKRPGYGLVVSGELAEANFFGVVLNPEETRWVEKAADATKLSIGKVLQLLVYEAVQESKSHQRTE